MALASLMVGFLLFVGGLALWSVPAALIVAGFILFISGGLELRQETGRRRTP